MIGLDVSDRSIKVIDLADTARHKLRTACWSPLAPNLMRRGVIQDSAGVVVGIKEALTRCTGAALHGSTAVLSIPETQSFVRALELPLMSNRETDEAVQWAIRQHIPFDLDRVYIDWQPIPSGSSRADRQEVLVGAAQRDVIDPLLAVVDEVGLRVVALELEAQAIVRSLLPPDSQTVTGVVIVDLGATSTNVIFFDRGSIRFTTSVQRGGDDLTQQLAQTLRIAPQQAAETKAQSSGEEVVVDTLRTAALSLIRQIGQVVDDMTKKYDIGNEIRTILLSGGSANLPGIVDLFTEVFPGIPVQVGNPLINLLLDAEKDHLPISQEDATHFATAIGLALRHVDYSERG